MKDPREVTREKWQKRRRELLIGGMVGLIVSPFVVSFQLSPFDLWPVLQTHRALKSRTLEIPVKQQHGFDPNAIVILLHASVYENAFHLAEGSGFAIGDGSFVLTAAHCLRLENRKQKALSEGVYVVSPHYGDIYPCDIIAVDPHADVALLRPAWQDHPALTLGTEHDLKAAARLWVATRSLNDSSAFEDRSMQPLSGDRLCGQARMELLPVKRIHRSEQRSIVTLNHSRYVIKGWSGSPFISPVSGQVLGLATQILGDHTWGRLNHRDAVGCGLETIEQFLQHHGIPMDAAVGDNRSSVPNAAVAYKTLCNLTKIMASDMPAAHRYALELAQLRPTSPPVHQWLAMTAAVLFQRDETRKSLPAQVKQALQHSGVQASQDAHGLAVSANLLRECGFDEASWTWSQQSLVLDPNNELALYNGFLYQQDRDPNGACELAQELVMRHPHIGDFWRHYSEILYQQKHYDEAADAAQHAVTVDPNGLYGRFLARALEKTGQLDEARTHYADMTRACACQGCWLAYANFLLVHEANDPHALDQAEQAVHAMDTSQKRKNLGSNREKIKVKLLKAQLALHPNRADHWYRYARYLLQHDPNNSDKIEEALQKASDPNRSHPVPAKDLHRLRDRHRPGPGDNTPEAQAEHQNPSQNLF